jgi:hypothetical protein
MVKKTRRIKRGKTRRSKGGMLKILTAAAAVAAGRNSELSTGLTEYKPSGIQNTSVALTVPSLPSMASPRIIGSDSKGLPVTPEEASRRITAWETAVREKSKTPSMNSNDVCSVASAAGPAPICDGNIGIPRNLMPQIKKDKRASFLDFVRAYTGDNSIVEDKEIGVEELMPTQRELMQDGIEKSKIKLNRGNTAPNPIIVAHDPDTGKNQIFDGHHRWAAHANSNKPKNKIMNVTMINLSIDELLKIAAAWGAPHEEVK